MAGVSLVCVDGSARCTEAVREGLAVISDRYTPVLVTAIEVPDPTLVTGTGFAGGTMSPGDFEQAEAARMAAAEDLLSHAAQDLGLEDARTSILFGEPGAAICISAEEQDAAVIVMGSRGRGGVTRALLGSVSDHVVRHAPCPVVVCGQAAAD